MTEKEISKMAVEKIGGFDKWEVESAARKLIEVEELKKRPKFYAVVKKELLRQAQAAEKAAIEAKVGKKLKTTFED